MDNKDVFSQFSVCFTNLQIVLGEVEIVLIDVKRKLNMKHVLIVSACVFASMLFGCAYTSPLFPYYNNSDSAIFMLIGRGICEGKTCYVDLFDHKGPVLFFIEALGWKIGGRAGIWLLECIAMIISVFAVEDLCRKLKAEPIIPVFASAMILFFTIGHGNLSEDYCLPLLYISLLFAIKFLVSGEEKHPPKYALFYGIAFGLIAFIRINNALIVCSLVLCIAVDLICKKQYGNLAANLVAGLFGISLVAVPVCLYFYLHHALGDMIYATFLYNLLYAKGRSHAAIFSDKFLEFAVFYAPLVFALVVFITNKALIKAVRLTMITVTGLSLLMLLYSNIYSHYFTLAIPMFTVSVAVALPDASVKNIFKIRTGKKTAATIVLSVITLIYVGLSAYRVAAPIYKGYLTDISYDRYHQMNVSAEIIPEDERDSVIGFNIPPEWYMDCDIVPCYKYYIFQNWWTTPEFDVYGDFITYVETEHPTWLITGLKMGDKKLLDIIDNNYMLQNQNDYACFYRYVEGGGIAP